LLKHYRAFAKKHGVKESDTVYDSDGIGAYLRGFLPAAIFFNGAARPIYDPQVGQKEKYMNLRSQCYYLTCMDINDAALSIMNCDPVTKQRIIDEFAAIKVYISDGGVVSVSSKDELKSALGTSPDLSDTIMMKKYRDLILITNMEGDLESISGVY
jgi:hypothetical protein